MFFPQPTPARDPLELEPQNRLNSHGVSVVVDGTKAVGKPFRVDLPSTGIGPGSIAYIPSRIHPPIIELDVFLAIAIQKQLLTRFVGPRHFSIPEGARGRELGSESGSTGMRKIMRQHPLTPQVLS